MSYVDDILTIRIGTPEFHELRKQASEGRADALKKYVYWCAWRSIRSDIYIPKEKKYQVFKGLVKFDAIEVKLV